MNKATSYAAKLGLAGFFLGGLFDILKQYSERDPRIDFQPDWGKSFGTALKVGAVGAGTGLVIGALTDEELSKEFGGVMALFLARVDSEFSVEEVPYQIKRKIDKLITALEEQFKDSLDETPYLGGSHEKKIATIFSDYDLNVHFSSNAGTLEEIYQGLLGYFEINYSDPSLKKVRAQGKSVGLFFEIDGSEVKIDIVPKRLQKGSQALSMYVNPDLSGTDKLWIKTNPDVQASVIPDSSHFQRVLRLLKLWREKNDINIGSTYLMYLVSEAFIDINKDMPKKIDEQLVTVLQYVCENLIGKRVVDPSNSSNILSESLTLSEKETLKNSITDMIADINETPRNIVTYFPGLKN